MEGSMRLPTGLLIIALCISISGCAFFSQQTGPGKDEYWRALHLLNSRSDADLEKLAESLPDLAAKGLNVLIIEVDYHFEFTSHPELRSQTCITKQGAKKFATACRANGIRLIPQFQCVGHQSWDKSTFPLLTVYPEFDLTPGAFPGNEGLYCREWDITNPRVYDIVYDLVDEIIDAFDADAFHVGMDEIFLIGSDESPATKGKDPAKLFAKAVNDMYDHIVRKRKVEMLIWADRFIDSKKMNFGKWEASKNGTAPAIDMVPRDIIMCPWHYQARDSYPSIPMFLEKGFRVLPASWRDVDAARKLIDYSLQYDQKAMLGHMFTTWGEGGDDLSEWPPMVKGLTMLTGKNGDN